MTSKAGDNGLKAAEDDLIHCPICFDVFDNPRSMPCLHTYCYKCLDRLCRDKISGADSVSCPICRKDCTIPPEGVVGFVHNFFIQDMIDESRPDTTQKSAVVCEVCADDNKTAKATKYCIDCRLRLCERCNKHHSRMNGGNHRIRENGVDLERELVQLASSYCIEHANEMLQLYCFNCSCNVCVSCVDKRHPKHELQRIETVAVNFKSQMSADLVAVRKRVDETTRQDQRQKSALKDFSDRMASIVNAVDKQCRDAISYFETVINSEKQKILLVLQLTKEKALKQFSEIEERTNLSLVSMKSFINYAEELRNKGKSCDLTRAGIDMHKRASEILTEYPVDQIYNGPSVEFKAENVQKLLASVIKNGIVGSLVKTDDDTEVLNRVVPSKPVTVQQISASQPSVAAAAGANRRTKVSVQSTSSETAGYAMQHTDRSSRAKTAISRTTFSGTHVISASEDRRGGVAGLTVHGDELFLVRYGSKGLIEVYNATNFTFKRNIRVKELERVSYNNGLTSCDSNNCLYVCYWYNDVMGHFPVGYIARIDLSGDNKVIKWKVDGGYEPEGLSVNSEHNLMVACSVIGSQALIEYTTHGELVRKIILPDDVVCPWHAIKLNSNRILVSHGVSGEDTLRTVCAVDANGRVILSYDNKLVAKTGRLLEPRHLAVDKNGFIFLADYGNNRIVVLDSTLKWSRDLKIDPSVGGLKHPYSLYLDERRKLLFIGELNRDDSRVVVVPV